MATNSKELRINLSEEDTTVIYSICKVLNTLANPQAKNGFSFKTTQDRLSICVYRARETFPAFEVSLKTHSESEIDENSLLTLNALFKECIPHFDYDESSKHFIISLLEEYFVYSKGNENVNANSDSDWNTCVEEDETIISLMKPFNELEQIIQLFNMVKIKKLLTISNNLLTISALGREVSILVQFTVVRQVENFKIPYFCSKCNYLHSLGRANFIFTVTTLASKTLLHIAIVPPKDDSEYKKFCETLELIRSISSFAKKD